MQKPMKVMKTMKATAKPMKVMKVKTTTKQAMRAMKTMANSSTKSDVTKEKNRIYSKAYHKVMGNNGCKTAAKREAGSIQILLIRVADLGLVALSSGPTTPEV